MRHYTPPECGRHYIPRFKINPRLEMNKGFRIVHNPDGTSHYVDPADPTGTPVTAPITNYIPPSVS